MLQYFEDWTFWVLLYDKVADVAFPTVVFDLLQTLRGIQIQIGRYSNRPQVSSDAQQFFGCGAVSKRTNQCIGQLRHWHIIVFLHCSTDNLPSTALRCHNNYQIQWQMLKNCTQFKYGNHHFCLTAIFHENRGFLLQPVLKTCIGLYGQDTRLSPKQQHLSTHTHTHTQPFYCWSGICPGPPGSAGTRKVKPRRLKPIWIYWSKR